LSTINSLNAIYPGRVLLHFDAFASVSTEPMGLFANQKASVEETTIKNLASLAVKNHFDLIFPVIGAWTYSGSIYGGTLYNSLSKGTFARNTETNFIGVMKTI
jgi:hypothetical protein